MSNVSNNIGCASSLSKATSWQDAVKEVSDACRNELGQDADLALAFLSADFTPHANQIAMALCEELGTQKLAGCTGESLVGRKQELEMAAGLSVWTAALPGVSTDVLKLEFLQTADGGTVTGWPDELSVPWDDDSLVVLLADPYTFPADWLLERMHEDRPRLPIFGGNASAASVPGDNRLLVGAQAFDCGAVAVVLRNLPVRSIVSQGCRPVGQPLVVTRVEGNTIHELGGKPAAAQLLSVYDELPTREKQLMQSGVHLGRVVSEYQDEFDAYERNSTAVADCCMMSTTVRMIPNARLV